MPYVLKGRIYVGGGELEFIESCNINDAGELVFITNLGRELNAGKLPVGELTEQNLQDIINYINEHITEGDLFTDEFYEEIIKKINEMAGEGDVFTDEIYQEFIDYINNHIKDGDVFTDEFYDTIIDRINENEPNPAVITTTKEDDTVNVRVAYGNNTTSNYVITLNGSGYPDTVTYDNGSRACLLRWEGFE